MAVLNSGDKLGSYEITGLLGRGGMGEVYRARDARLKRDVAIKALPKEFSRDPDRVSRFQREAELLAALNHPNIAAIYNLEESSGSQYLVLELVEGETLADRLSRDRLSIAEALHIATKVCEALEAAHEKGVVHRDLKPANIKLTPDGKVKVLDFGLAKLTDVAANDITASNSPTMLSGTLGGVILGTAGYMSPEQAKGKIVDKRADIWAFGCVLYEMLTGKQAFAGDSVAEMLAKILEREPDLNLLPVETPGRLREVCHRCLRKDAQQRFRDIGDVRIEIEDLLANPTANADTNAVSITHKKRERVAWAVVVALGFLAVLEPIVFRLRMVVAPEPHEIRFDIPAVRTPLIQGDAGVAVSPDGRSVVFVAQAEGGARQLFVRDLNNVSAQAIAGTNGAAFPFWSPDGHSIGFFADAQLKRIDISGGSPQMLAAASSSPFGAAWSAENTIVFAPGRQSGLYRVTPSGFEATQILKADPRQAVTGQPAFLPDGRHLLYAVGGTPDVAGIYAMAVDGSNSKRLVTGAAFPAYASPDKLLFVRQGTLYVQSFNPVKMEVSGDPVRIQDRVAAASVSGPGIMVYRAAAANNLSQMIWFDRNGKNIGVLEQPVPNQSAVELSPDGKRVATHRTTGGISDVWLIDIDRGVSSRFTFGSGSNTFPIWSPDGQNIVFTSNRPGQQGLYIKPSNGSQPERLLLALPPNSPNIVSADWSRDGRFLAYRLFGAQNGNPDPWILPMEGDRNPFAWLTTPFDESNQQFSPDTRWGAYCSDESGRLEVYIQSFPKAGAKWQASIGGGVAPRWRPDGKELFYIGPDSSLMAVTVAALPDGSLNVGKPSRLFQTRIMGGFSNNVRKQYAATPDGQRFLINSIVEDKEIPPITAILNWTERLKK
jgi:eukaryotic-like serine/threonine-protein kinase